MTIDHIIGMFLLFILGGTALILYKLDPLLRRLRHLESKAAEHAVYDILVDDASKTIGALVILWRQHESTAGEGPVQPHEVASAVHWAIKNLDAMARNGDGGDNAGWLARLGLTRGEVEALAAMKSDLRKVLPTADLPKMSVSSLASELQIVVQQFKHRKLDLAVRRLEIAAACLDSDSKFMNPLEELLRKARVQLVMSTTTIKTPWAAMPTITVRSEIQELILQAQTLAAIVEASACATVPEPDALSTSSEPGTASSDDGTLRTVTIAREDQSLTVDVRCKAGQVQHMVATDAAGEPIDLTETEQDQVRTLVAAGHDETVR